MKTVGTGDPVGSGWPELAKEKVYNFKLFLFPSLAS